MSDRTDPQTDPYRQLAIKWKDELEQKDAEIERLRAALEIIAGQRQPLDNLMSNLDVAREALKG